MKNKGTALFRGATAISIDSKGRLAVPAKYRELLAEYCAGQLVATIDTESRCLLIYPLPEWEEIQKKLEALPSFNPAARRIQRLLIGHASDLELDSNGRILLPATLREYAGLNKKLMLVGQGNKMELWSEELWYSSREEWIDQANGGNALPAELESFSL